MKKSLLIWSLFILAGAGRLHAETIPVPVPDAPMEESVEVSVSSDVVQSATETVTSPLMLKIVHPSEGAHLPPLKTTFVYGQATPTGKLKLNGQDVPIHSGGGFLAMLPFSYGKFTINAELTSGTTTVKITRRVFIVDPPQTSPASPMTIEYVKPDQDMEVRPGDVISIVCKGSPGMEGYYQIDDVHGKFPLTENSPTAAVRGIYRGNFIVQERDNFKDAKLKVTLLDNKKDRKVTKQAEGKLSRLIGHVPEMVEVATDTAVLRAGPSFSSEDKLGYVIFPPVGTRLQVVGRTGTELKVRLAKDFDLWISEKEIRRLPEGTPTTRTVAGSLTVSAKGRSTEVRVAMGQKIPFSIWPADDGSSVDVLLYGASSNTDWSHYDSTGGVVQQVRWSQDAGEIFRLHVQTPPDSWWGYDARYDGSTFILELRSPPPLAKGGVVLKDLTVAVDAGHSSDIGSIGPTSLLEKDANLDIAKCLKKKLEADGAKVYMLREGMEHVGLYDRPKMAWKAKADVLISVHNNALPDGGNPFEKNGYGVYYFHPQSFDLARQIHKAYGEIIGADKPGRSGLRDDGLHYGNLALPRTPQMPSVLTESAYIIVPREEDLLRTEEFQCDCADAMVRGLKRYVRHMRRVQSGLVKPAWKAQGAPASEEEHSHNSDGSADSEKGSHSERRDKR